MGLLLLELKHMMIVLVIYLLVDHFSVVTPEFSSSILEPNLLKM